MKRHLNLINQNYIIGANTEILYMWNILKTNPGIIILPNYIQLNYIFLSRASLYVTVCLYPSIFDVNSFPFGPPYPGGVYSPPSMSHWTFRRLNGKWSQIFHNVSFTLNRLSPFSLGPCPYLKNIAFLLFTNLLLEITLLKYFLFSRLWTRIFIWKSRLKIWKIHLHKNKYLWNQYTNQNFNNTLIHNLINIPNRKDKL